MFEILKLKTIVSKKTGKIYTLVLFSLFKDDDLKYYKAFLPGEYKKEELEDYSLVNVGFGIGLSDGVNVFSAENII